MEKKEDCLEKITGKELNKGISELLGNIINAAMNGEDIGRLKTKIASSSILSKDTIKQNRQIELIRDIFWFCVNDGFDLFEKPVVGVRKGFKVVWREHEKDNRDGQAKPEKCFICGEIHS